jgi:hypothetical protein
MQKVPRAPSEISLQSGHGAISPRHRHPAEAGGWQGIFHITMIFREKVTIMSHGWVFYNHYLLAISPKNASAWIILGIANGCKWFITRM